MRSIPSLDLEVGKSYTFNLKRHGTSRLAEYQATYLGEDGDRLVFTLIGHSMVRVRVYADRVERGSVRELA